MGKTINEKLKGKTLEEIKAIIIALNEAVCKAGTVDKRNEIEDELDEHIGYYNNAQKTACYTKCKKAKYPMRKAVETFFYPTIRIKETVDKKAEIPVIVRTVVESEKAIDLLDFDKQCDLHGEWKYSIQKFNRYMTADVAKGINDDLDLTNFHIAEAAKKIDMGKTPLSKRQVISTIQGIVNAMLGEDYKADPEYPKAFNVNQYDWRYLTEGYSRINNKTKGGLKASNHKALTFIFMNIAYRVLMGEKGYHLQQKEIKNPKK